MLEIRIFRFDPKCDVGSYLKPYLCESANFASVKELLEFIRSGDPYFSFEDVKFVKINGTVVALDEDFGEIVAKFGKNLIITPLNKREAYKDLSCRFNSFLSKFDEFASIANADTMEFYKELAPYFYANEIPKFSEIFLGNSGFVFANFLLENFSEKRAEILKFIAPQLPYYEPCNALNLEYDCALIYDKLCELCGHSRAQNDKILSSESMAEIDTSSLKHRFDGFKVAVWDDEAARNLAQKLGSDIVDFERQNAMLGREIYAQEKSCALRMAGEILFDAFDSGADFLLVNSKNALSFIDGKAGEICALFNRELLNFYLLSTDEFIALARGEKPSSLANHKLKVRLI